MRKTVLALILLLTASGLPVWGDPGYSLAYDFKPGESFYFSMEMLLETHMYTKKPGDGGVPVSSMNQHISMEIELKVLETDFMDNFIIEERITGLRLTMDDPVALSADLSDPRERSQWQGEPGFEPLILLVENPVTFTLSREGELYEYDLSGIKNALEETGQTDLLASVENLLDQMVENLFYDFPDTPLKVGDSYERAYLSQYLPAMGTISSTGIFTLERVEEKEGDTLLHFSAAGKSTFKRDPESAIEMALDRISPEGRFSFSLNRNMVREGTAAIKAGFTYKAGDWDAYMEVNTEIRYRSLIKSGGASNPVPEKPANFSGGAAQEGEVPAIIPANCHTEILRRLPPYTRSREVYLFDMEKINDIPDNGLKASLLQSRELFPFRKYIKGLPSLGEVHRGGVIGNDETYYFFVYIDLSPQKLIPQLKKEGLTYKLEKGRLTWDSEDEESFSLENNVLVLTKQGDPLPRKFSSPAQGLADPVWKDYAGSLEDFQVIYYKMKKYATRQDTRLLSIKISPENIPVINTFIVCNDPEEAADLAEEIQIGIKKVTSEKYLLHREGKTIKAEIPMEATEINLLGD